MFSLQKYSYRKAGSRSENPDIWGEVGDIIFSRKAHFLRWIGIFIYLAIFNLSESLFLLRKAKHFTKRGCQLKKKFSGFFILFFYSARKFQKFILFQKQWACVISGKDLFARLYVECHLFISLVITEMKLHVNIFHYGII